MLSRQNRAMSIDAQVEVGGASFHIQKYKESKAGLEK